MKYRIEMKKMAEIQSIILAEQVEVNGETKLMNLIGVCNSLFFPEFPAEKSFKIIFNMFGMEANKEYRLELFIKNQNNTTQTTSLIAKSQNDKPYPFEVTSSLILNVEQQQFAIPGYYKFVGKLSELDDRKIYSEQSIIVPVIERRYNKHE